MGVHGEQHGGRQRALHRLAQGGGSRRPALAATKLGPELVGAGGGDNGITVGAAADPLCGAALWGHLESPSHVVASG